MKKFLLTTIAVLFSAMLWAETIEDGTKEHPFIIKTADELFAFAAKVNGGESCSGQYWALGAHIDLGARQDNKGLWTLPANAKEWTPIGDKLHPFSGNFNGKNYVITGIYFNNNEKEYVGLFGHIKNATLEKVVVGSGFLFGYERVSGICGYATGSSQIKQCANNATVFGKKENNGGICGQVDGSSTVSDCINYGTISAFNYSGGVCGRGSKATDNVVNCVNAGQVFCMRWTAAAIVGNGKNGIATINNCFYDNQICYLTGITKVETFDLKDQNNDVAGQYEGLPTTSMIGDGLKDKLDNDIWVFEEGHYPRLKGTDTHASMVLASAAVVLADGENIDSVSNNVALMGNFAWESTSAINPVSINGNQMSINTTGQVRLVGKNDIYYKVVSMHTEKGANSNSSFTINSKADLMALMSAVKNYGEYKGVYCYDGFKGSSFTMTRSIDLTGDANWEPIGAHNAFKGNFNGNNNTISGFNVCENGNIAIMGGVFGCAANGKISNLVVEGKVNGKQFVGGVCGASFCEKFENCVSKCNITLTDKYAGGIIGVDKGYSKFIGCINQGNITVAQYAGGILADCNVGSTLENCENSGVVTASTASGLIGGMCGNATNQFRAKGCINYGEIKGLSYCGGIVGDSKNNGVFENCTNHAVISGNGSQCGGIIGRGTNVILTRCTNFNSISMGASSVIGGIVGVIQDGVVTYCDNYGAIVSNKTCIGGIVGYSDNSATISYCANNGNVGGASNVGGIIGEIKSAGATIVSNSVNNATISGTYNTGGIVGAITTSQAHCVINNFNAGYINSTSTTIGGIVGLLADGTTCETNINIGKATNGITSSTADQKTIKKCFTDKQITGVASFSYTTTDGNIVDCDTLATRKLLDSVYMKGYLGSENWSYAANRYPLPIQLVDNPIAKAAAAVVLLAENETMSNVESDFNVSDYATWGCEGSYVAFGNTSTNGYNDGFVGTTNEDKEFVVRAKVGDAVKEIRLNIKASTIENTPVIAWDFNSNLNYGEPITANHLNASATVDGSTVEGEYIYSVVEGTILPIGTHNITVVFKPTNTQLKRATASRAITITKTQPTISIEQNAITYGQTIAEGFAKLEFVDNLGNPIAGKIVTIPQLNNIPEYKQSGVGVQIFFTPSNYKYYETVSTTATIEINKKELIVSGKNDTIKYGDTAPKYELSYNGFVRNESASDINTLPTASCEIGEGNVGNYFIIVSGGDDDNYTIVSDNSGMLTIAKAPLTIGVNNETITYGDAKPEFVFTYSGFVNNEDETVLSESPIATCEESNFGVHNIVISGGQSDNYDISYANSTLTIDKAPLTIGVKNATVKYGDTPKYEFTYNGFVNNEDASVLTAKPTAVSEGTNVGTHNITISSAEANNYSIDYAKDGVLTIEKAPLVVGVKDATIKEGERMPEFELTYDGFVNNEDASALSTLPTAVCSGDKVGEYEIVVSGGEAENYALTYTNGKLTITEANAGVGITGQDAVFSIYPNPVVGELYIETDQIDAVVEVFTAIGELVETVIIDNNVTVIDFTNKSKGTYLVKVGNNVSKVIKK